MLIRINRRLEEENKDGAGGAAAGTAAGNAGAAGATDAGGTAGGDAGTAGASNGGGTPVKTNWPENWRQLTAGKEEAEVKRLGRFATPADLYRSYRALEQRFDSGEFKAVTPFPTNGSDEQKSQWRKANGVPDSADKYDFKLPEGTVIGEFDKPAIDSFAKMAHESNLPADFVSKAVNWYFNQQTQIAEERQTMDTAFQRQSEDALRAEWGPEYHPNLNMISGLLNTAPKGVKEKLFNGRLSDGSPIGSDPDVLRFLVQVAREINPAGTLVPATGGSQLGSIQEEKAKIEKVMREDRKSYNADQGMQERYRQLIDAEMKLNSRVA